MFVDDDVVVVIVVVVVVVACINYCYCYSSPGQEGEKRNTRERPTKGVGVKVSLFPDPRGTRGT